MTKPFKQRIKDEWAFQRHGQDAELRSRPNFWRWLKISWIDILTMLIIGAVGLGFDKLWPPYHRLFLLDPNGVFTDPTIAYPKIPPVLGSAAAGILCIAVPLIIFLIAQFWLRNFWSFNNAVMGLLYANIAGTCFQVMVKSLIGGLRPHFLQACQPDPTMLANGQGYNGVYHDWTICTGDPAAIKNALISFPSGHTEAAFAGFGFLFLWLNAHMKVWSAHQPRFWKIVILYIPILGAVLIAGNLQMTYNHHWYDILLGALIGIVFAITCYRAMFQSVWDPRTDHVPIMRKGKERGEGVKERSDSGESSITEPGDHLV